MAVRHVLHQLERAGANRDLLEVAVLLHDLVGNDLMSIGSGQVVEERRGGSAQVEADRPLVWDLHPVDRTP